jgi:phage protein D
VVDQSVLRPGMFELTFLDTDGQALTLSSLQIGSEVTVSLGGPPSPTKLIVGEVTSIEGDYDQVVHYTIVRGFEPSHRLQRARRSRTFLNETDGAIARRVADDLKLKTGTIEDPGVEHAYVAQVAQTDWEFLKSRAHEIGYETGVADGEFYFRRAPGMPAGGGIGGLADAAGSVAAMAGIGGPPTLTFGKNLRWLRPRVSSSGLMGEAEVRVWDPEGVAVVSGTTKLASQTAKVADEPGKLAAAHGGPALLKALPSLPFLPSFLGASNDAYAVVDRPLASGSNAQSAADAVAAGMAEHVASTFAEAEGECLSTTGVVPGAKVTLANVAAPFGGEWYVTTARHTFDVAEGYRTRFEVSGRHDRSLHGLVTGGLLNRRQRGLIDGLVPGLVTDNVDSDGSYRVKVALPWLSKDFVTDWARVVMPGLGANYGSVCVPEVGDEVLVGFEFGDVRRAYVLGGLANGETQLELGGDAVKSGLTGGTVVKRGMISRLGHKILIDDDGDGALPPSKSGVTIGTADDKIMFQYDEVAKKLTILCDSTTPPAAIEIKQNGSGGSISIEQAGAGGSLRLKSAGSVTVEAAAPGSLTLKGGTGVKIDGGTGAVELSGLSVKLN